MVTMIEMVGPMIARALRASSTVGSIRRADAQSQCTKSASHGVTPLINHNVHNQARCVDNGAGGETAEYEEVAMNKFHP